MNKNNKLDVIKLEDNSLLFLGKFEHIVVNKITRVYFTRNAIRIALGGTGFANIWVPKTDYNLKQMEKIGFKE